MSYTSNNIHYSVKWTDGNDLEQSFGDFKARLESDSKKNNPSSNKPSPKS